VIQETQLTTNQSPNQILSKESKVFHKIIRDGREEHKQEKISNFGKDAKFRSKPKNIVGRTDDPYSD
jgi:hypothetical protein